MPKIEFVKDIDYYLEEGRVIFTAHYLKKRGVCCGNQCRHCPFDPINIKGNRLIQDEYLEKELLWWKKLSPDEQQTMSEKYYPNNMFGALALEDNEIKNIFENEHK